MSYGLLHPRGDAERRRDASAPGGGRSGAAACHRRPGAVTGWPGGARRITCAKQPRGRSRGRGRRRTCRAGMRRRRRSRGRRRAHGRRTCVRCGATSHDQPSRSPSCSVSTVMRAALRGRTSRAPRAGTKRRRRCRPDRPRATGTRPACEAAISSASGDQLAMLAARACRQARRLSTSGQAVLNRAPLVARIAADLLGDVDRRPGTR